MKFKLFNTSLTSIVSAMGAFAALTSVTSVAHAGGFAIREQSAEFQGSSFAGAAAGGHGLSSMYFNPATVTLHDGFHTEGNYSAIIPYSKTKNAVSSLGMLRPLSTDGNSGNIGVFSLVPASYASYQLNDRIYLGLSLNAPFGLETNSKGYAGSPYGNKSEVFNIVATPTVGIKLTDRLSFAIGPQISYIRAKLTTGGSIGPNNAYTKLKGDDVAAGIVAGLLFKFNDKTRIGLGYRSQMNHKLDGHLTTAAAKFGAEVPLKTPDMATLSVRHQLNDKVTLLGSVEWANWSNLKSLDVTLDNGVTTSEPYNWKDSWMFSVGSEWQASDKLMLRAGYAFETTPTKNSTRTPRSPDSDRHWLSIGASYQFNDTFLVHAGYSHVFMKSAKVNLKSLSNGTPLELKAKFKQHLDIVSVGGTITW